MSVHREVLQDMADGKTVPTADGMWQVAWMARNLLKCWDEISRLEKLVIEYRDKQSVPVAEIDEPTPTCGDCGRPTQKVRPGKWQCDSCVVKAEQEPKPRRMRENPTPNASANHWHEHDENAYCRHYGCQPVEPAPAAPDTGEGWELCERDVAQSSWDKQGGCWVDIVYAKTTAYRRRVESEEAWHEYVLKYDDDEMLTFWDHTGEAWFSYQAPSLRGFMGFVYDHPDCIGVSVDPVLTRFLQDDEIKVVFPVAVRFAKPKRGEKSP